MKTPVRALAMLGIGAALGVLLSFGQGVLAKKDAGSLPIEDLRTFTEVFVKIKSDYVEAIDGPDPARERHQGDARGARSALRLPGAGGLRGAPDRNQGGVRRAGHRGGNGGRLRPRDRSHRRHAGGPRRHPGRRPRGPARRPAGEGHEPGRGGQDHAGRAGHRHYADRGTPGRGRPPEDHHRPRRDPRHQRQEPAAGGKVRLRAHHAVPVAHGGEPA